ncbi:MAG: hypothetical protein IKO72_12070 [Kiritimatiellae bacterium]|nr:hypothetical protein [Kiritimatiellia bacterium]
MIDIYWVIQNRHLDITRDTIQKRRLAPHAAILAIKVLASHIHDLQRPVRSIDEEPRRATCRAMRRDNKSQRKDSGKQLHHFSFHRYFRIKELKN